jgi:DNA/RNA endonuclease YhcR with UshA esterase domain
LKPGKVRETKIDQEKVREGQAIHLVRENCHYSKELDIHNDYLFNVL